VVAVVTPALEASTAAVYAALDSSLPGPGPAPTVGPDLLAQPVDSLRARLVNDLESAALAAVPGLATWRDVVDRDGAGNFLLSGSGSSFFGLFEDVDSASRCLSELTDLARVRGVAWRAARVVAPAGHGARLDPSPA
jgi:4-diphosphocytidyl-2-C-methyl-D-erythritol kinase